MITVSPCRYHDQNHYHIFALCYVLSWSHYLGVKLIIFLWPSLWRGYRYGVFVALFHLNAVFKLYVDADADALCCLSFLKIHNFCLFFGVHFQAFIKQPTDRPYARPYWHDPTRLLVSLRWCYYALQLFWWLKLMDYDMCRDMSNNSFDATDFPSWLIALPSLTDLYCSFSLINVQPFLVSNRWYFMSYCYFVATDAQTYNRLFVFPVHLSSFCTLYITAIHSFLLSTSYRMMERTQIEGEVPETLFSLPHLHQV